MYSEVSFPFAAYDICLFLLRNPSLCFFFFSFLFSFWIAIARTTDRNCYPTVEAAGAGLSAVLEFAKDCARPSCHVRHIPRASDAIRRGLEFVTTTHGMNTEVGCVLGGRGTWTRGAVCTCDRRCGGGVGGS